MQQAASRVEGSESLISLVKELTVRSEDDGARFTDTTRKDRIVQLLEGTSYRLWGETGIAMLYHKEDFDPAQGWVLISCHIDSLYDIYSFEQEAGHLEGTFDNSVCNAVLVWAMQQGVLPSQVVITFTGDEEDESRGVEQTIAFLEANGSFSQLELVLTMDVTEFGYGSSPVSVENYFVEKYNNQHSLLKFASKRAFKNQIMTFLPGAPSLPDDDPEAAEDESFEYKNSDLNCFSLCLPCEVIDEDMHDRAGVRVRSSDLPEYLNALTTVCVGFLNLMGRDGS